MKTNKIKPIKKIMIFTIITVMIVSLFAVPAFAIDGAPALSQYFQSSTGQFYVNTGQYSDLLEIDGCYAVIFDYVNFYDLAMQGYTTQYVFNTDEGFGYDVLLLNSNYEVIGCDYYVGAIGLDSNSEMFYAVANTSRPPSSGFPISECSWVALSFTSYPPDFSATATSLEIALFDYEHGEPTRFVTLTSEPITPDPEEPDDPTPPADGEEQGIFAVWSQITQWIVQGLASVSNAFYTNGKLTLLGTLCIIPLALGIAFLLIAIIQKFLRLRG